MAESDNLSELHTPLCDLIANTAVTGKETAKNFYNARGWTAHHNVDIWATSNPVSGSPMWANWPLGELGSVSIYGSITCLQAIKII